MALTVGKIIHFLGYGRRNDNIYLKWSLHCSKWPSSGRRLPVIQRQSADPASPISSASGNQKPTTTQIQNCRSPKFALDLSTGSGNLTEVNKIATHIGHRACTT